MVMSDLYASFQKEMNEHNSKFDAMCEAKFFHEQRATELREQAEQELREAEKVRKDIKALPRLDWTEKLVRPLAEELSRRSAKKNFTVMGPVGLSFAVHIALHDDPEYVPSVLRDETYLELTVHPDSRDGVITLRYETGKEDENCPKGGIGGLNRVTAPLPDSIEEIENLLRPSMPITKIVKVLRFEGNWPSYQNTHTVIYEDGTERDFSNFDSLPDEVVRFIATAEGFGFGYRYGRYYHFFQINVNN